MKEDKPIVVTFPSGQVASRIVDLVVHNKPVGAGRRSQYPYYTESYAKWVKSEVDKMIGNELEVLYRYEVFCTERTNISPLTLYIRVNQAVRYLIDHMDTEAKYAKWRETVEIAKDPKRRGVVIRYKPEFLAGGMMRPEFSSPHEAMPLWQRRMEEWLESEDKKPFCQENLCLSKEQIQQLVQQFEGLKGVLPSIKGDSVKIVRLS